MIAAILFAQIDATQQLFEDAHAYTGMANDRMTER
jgi:hypothetical protein